MTSSTRRILIALTCFGLLYSTLDCTSRTDHSRWERSVSAASVPVANPNAGVPTAIALPLPTAEDVRQAIARIYGDAIQAAGTSPHYVIGDFNGDGSDDLAVEVRPANGKIANLNDAAANWILEDPSRIFVPDPSKRVQKLPSKPEQPHVRSGQSLLAIVHGYGPQGWREPLARQGYLLLNVPDKKISLQKNAEVLAQTNDAMPHLFGDLIRTERSGQPALLFWTGGHYAWLATGSRSREVGSR